MLMMIPFGQAIAKSGKGTDSTPMPPNDVGQRMLNDKGILIMIKALLSTSGIVGGALLLSACSTSSPNAATGSAVQPTPLVVTSQENCQQVKLNAAQPLVVRFESNPSTGYQWSLLQESSILQLESSHFIAPRDDGNPPMVGAPGVHEWQFMPRQKGVDTLVFTYQQPWERTSYRKVECHITVE